MGMDAIEECSSDGGRHQGSRILVGVPNNSRGCSELLSWAIRVIAKPNDSIVAVHVLGNCLATLLSNCCSCMSSCSCLDDLLLSPFCRGFWTAGGRGRKNRLQKANAFVIYMLGEFVETCEAKQVQIDQIINPIQFCNRFVCLLYNIFIC
jgi:hypothetical protein